MNKLNTDLLLGIWEDIKQKRLAPVAIGLAVALLAMPVVMLRGGGGGEVESLLPLGAATGKPATEVEVAQEGDGRGSNLGSYKPRDPFEGKLRGGSKPKGGDPSGSAIVPEAGGGSDGGGSSPGGAPKPGGGTATPSVPDSGGGGGATGGSPPGSSRESKPQRAFYNFRLDVKFGRPGREKRYRSLSRMSFLPRPSLPVAMYMGVSEERDRAVFVVHGGMSHQGHGVCVPSGAKCHFLELKVGRDHYFSANDREFRMKLIGIKRVRADRDVKASGSARGSAPTARSERRTKGDGSGDDELPWPVLVDGVG